MNELPQVEWEEEGERRALRWRSESGSPPPRRVVLVGDQTPADQAYRLACEGSALLYRGDYQNARQLLLAMARRVDRKPRRITQPGGAKDAPQAFHLHRQSQAQRARVLGMIILPVDAGHVLPLRRAPDVSRACLEAYGPADEAYAVSLRELLGLIGAHEWRKKGVAIPALGASIHPHYGVFSPVRGEYVDLVAKAALPAALGSGAPACDIGTGTGVLAALLAKRGVVRVVAIDQDPRAIACARENIARLGYSAQVEIRQGDMFPDERPALVVCNPPWVPARPSSPIENAVYDPDGRMLRAFLDGLAAHLAPGGEGWLILSDLAEHLGLRTREELLAAIDAAGLQVLGRLDARPQHGKARNAEDPLHAARAAEVTSLWRLGVRG